MNALAQQIEAILFAAGRAMTNKQLEKQLGVESKDLAEALDQVAKHLNSGQSGIRLYVTAKEVALMTEPGVAEAVRDFLKKDVTGELTKPSVETLAIIAYRGPISKPELEQIRGVNCTMILRNLMIRGLICREEGRMGERYTVSMEYLKHLGVTSVSELPDYTELNRDELLSTLTSQLEV
jgi:segregation and condensation protein B